MRLLSWNVNRRIECIDRQVRAIARQKCDVVTLQEVNPRTIETWCHGFEKMGLQHVEDSLRYASTLRQPAKRRETGVLIASRYPLSVIPPDRFDVPWRECLLSVTLNSPANKIELHTTHIPPGITNGTIKINTLKGMYNGLAHQSDTPIILCGDLNTPQSETEHGEIIAWGKTGSDWNRCETLILQGLRQYGIWDVFRYQHGYSKQQYSWIAPHDKQRRYDHVFASWSLLNGVNCRYLHRLRDAGLSDHSAIVCDFMNVRG